MSSAAFEHIERHGRGQIIRRAYCLGFLFSPDWRLFVSIMKDHGPPAVVNRINGIGGKIEDGETPLDAMVREFTEETGLVAPVPRWEHFCTMEGEDWEVWCFRACAPTMEDFERCRTPAGQTEAVGHAAVRGLHDLPVVPNLRWLVPFALDMDVRVPHLIACHG
jgi:8-oxo-dGTP pyrophosphatase MutT (NUDIX family)